MAISRRFIEWLLVVPFIAGLFFAAHWWTTDRLGVLRAVYPLEALVARWSVRCSDDAPAWMIQLVNHAIDRQFSLSNQVAYREPSGRLHHCESGWLKAPLLSPRVTVDTRFRFASLTKLLTADAILAEANAGRLALDDRLLDHLPALPALMDDRIVRITVEQLLRHRAGVDRYITPDPMLIDNETPWCPERLDRLATLRLDFDPGTRFSYANLGYCLLGVVLERVSGKPFRELVAERYDLAGHGLSFIDGPYLADEVRYDFRNSDFYTERYYRHFSFSALSSSAGLSGSAQGLMGVLADMPHRRPMNLLSPARPVEDCNIRRYEGCFGYAVMLHQVGDSALTLQIQGGLMIGAASKAIFDSEGGITVWLGSGMSLDPLSASKAFAEALNELLVVFYQMER